MEPLSKPGGCRFESCRPCLAPPGPCRFDDLGRVQFERLCHALIDGVARSAWRTTATATVALLPSDSRWELPPPTLVVGAWGRNASEAWIRHIVRLVLDDWRHEAPRSILMLTNVSARPEIDGIQLHVLDSHALTARVLERPELLLRMPSLLGICDESTVVPDDVAARSTADIAAALALSHVFVPTRAYASTVGVLERFGFAVLTGPPEMGKTAIARMIGLA